MASPHACASRRSPRQGPMLLASFIRPGGGAVVFMTDAQPMNASAGTEMARSEGFIGSLSGADGEVKSSAPLSSRRGRRFASRLLAVVPQVFGEQHDLLDDDRDAGQKLRADGGQTIDERLQMPDLSEVVRQEIARLLAEGLGDVDEVLDIEPALVGFQPGELRRGDSHASGQLGLGASLRFAELPEKSAVHGNWRCTRLAN